MCEHLPHSPRPLPAPNPRGERERVFSGPGRWGITESRNSRWRTGRHVPYAVAGCSPTEPALCAPCLVHWTTSARSARGNDAAFTSRDPPLVYCGEEGQEISSGNLLSLSYRLLHGLTSVSARLLSIARSIRLEKKSKLCNARARVRYLLTGFSEVGKTAPNSSQVREDRAESFRAYSVTSVSLMAVPLLRWGLLPLAEDYSCFCR